jgi:4-hydroxybenzoate polyprenyltransferase
MKNLKAVIKFARLRVSVMLFALAFLGSASSGVIVPRLMIVGLLITIWYIHATSINDYADYEIDKINLGLEKDRPLVQGQLPASSLWKIHGLSLVAAIILSLSLGYKAVLLTICLLAAGYAYSLKPFRISDRGISAQFLLAATYVYYPLSLGYWVSKPQASYPWLLSFGLYCAFVARLLLKDFRDVKGDKKFKKMTFLLRRGVTTTIYTSLLFWILASLFIVIYVSFAPGVIIPVLIGLTEACLLLRNISQTKDLEQQRAISFIAKAANALIMTLLAYLLASSQTTLSDLEKTVIPSVIGTVLLAFNWLRYKTY